MSFLWRERYRLRMDHETSILYRRRERVNGWTRIADIDVGHAEVNSRFGGRMEEFLSESIPPRASVEVCIADDAIRHFLTIPPANARTVNDVRLSARLRFEALYGGAADGWYLEADYRATRQFLVSAVPTEIVEALTRGPGRGTFSKSRIVDVLPQFIADWNDNRHGMRDPDACVVHVGKRAMVVAACAKGSIDALTQVALIATPTHPAVSAEVQHARLRWGLPSPRTVYVLGGAIRFEPSPHESELTAWVNLSQTAYPDESAP